jgi:hypothetical protein
MKVFTNGYSFREKNFSEVDCIQAREDSSKPEEWKPRSESFLLELPIDRESVVLRVGVGYDSILMRWSDVIASYSVYECDWFNDENVLPAYASLLLFFFHDDALIFGKRRLSLDSNMECSL